MKKLLTLGLALSFAVVLAGCGNTEVSEEEAVAPVVEEVVVQAPVVEEAPVVDVATGVVEEVVATGAEVAEVTTGN